MISTGQTHVERNMPSLLHRIAEEEIDTTFLISPRLPLEEAFEMVMRGEICDGKTICGLMMAREIVARQKA